MHLKYVFERFSKMNSEVFSMTDLNETNIVFLFSGSI